MTFNKFVPVSYWNLFRREAFELIDLNAFKVSIDEFNLPDKLLKNLLLSSSLDDVMKTRAIFTWLSFVDVNKLNYQCGKYVELCKALNHLKFGGSYAEVFAKLASVAGINAVCIKGCAKGHNFTGHNSMKSPANHSWNAVEIQNKWLLVDCYWSKSVSEDGNPEMDDFYFFVDPQNMIYSHYPESQRWQLLKEPLTSYEAFMELPAYKPEFFKFKLQLIDHVIQDGLSILRLGHKGNVFFKFKIDKIGNGKSNGLKNLVFEELKKNSVTYYFKAPESGIYFLKIFASTSGNSFEPEAVIYKEVAGFKILADTTSSAPPIPKATDACWGPSKTILNDIFPSMTSACILAKDGKVNFTIKKMNDRIICLKFNSAKGSEGASLTYIEEDMKFNVTANIGCYSDCSLEMYLVDAESPKRFTFIGQFLICSENGFFSSQFLNSGLTSGSDILSLDCVNRKNKGESLSLDYASCNEEIKLKELYLLVTERCHKAPDDHSTKIILNKMKSGELSCAHAFEELCRLNGLSCITISGMLKETHAEAKNYQDLREHSWNVVSMKGSWKLVDCELSRKTKSQTEHSLNVDDYYFMTEPKEFIYTHFPSIEKWQLLESPLSHEAFQNLVRLKPAYFKNKLSLIQPTQNYLKVEGKTSVVLKQNIETSPSYSFLFYFMNDRKKKLNGYVMHYSEDDLEIFNLRFPFKGFYHFVLYTKHLTPEESLCDSEEICEFVMENQAECYLESFPGSLCQWGITDFARMNGIGCSPSNPLMETTEGTIDISLSSTSRFRFYIEFTNNTGEAVNDSVGFLRDEVGSLKIRAKCPKIGEYCLKVYAIDAEDFGASVSLALQMCIVFRGDIRVTHDDDDDDDDGVQDMLLKASFGFLGSQTSNDYFGVIYLGNSDMLESTRNVVALQFLDRLDLNLSCKLLRLDCESTDDFSSYVLKQKNKQERNFIVSLPHEGVYAFQLFASECADDFLNVYNVMISCKNVVNRAFEFPKQFHAWNGFLHQPLQRYISKDENRNVKFVLEHVPYEDIYLVSQNMSTPFIKMSDGCWNLDLDLVDFPTECIVKVCACRAQEFHELLEFVVS